MKEILLATSYDCNTTERLRALTSASTFAVYMPGRLVICPIKHIVDLAEDCRYCRGHLLLLLSYSLVSVQTVRPEFAPECTIHILRIFMFKQKVRIVIPHTRSAVLLHGETLLVAVAGKAGVGGDEEFSEAPIDDLIVFVVRFSSGDLSSPILKLCVSFL